MQKIRGYFYFKEKTLNNIKSALKGFKLDELQILFFNNLKREEKIVESPGFFLAGKVNKNYSSSDIIKIIRQQLSLDDEICDCDVSIEAEDTIEYLIKGAINGNYLGIRIKPKYILSEIIELAQEISKLISASDVLIRTVEDLENEPIVCLDLVYEKKVLDIDKKIKDMIKEKGLSWLSNTTIKIKN